MGDETLHAPLWHLLTGGRDSAPQKPVAQQRIQQRLPAEFIQVFRPLRAVRSFRCPVSRLTRCPLQYQPRDSSLRKCPFVDSPLGSGPNSTFQTDSILGDETLHAPLWHLLTGGR